VISAQNLASAPFDRHVKNVHYVQQGQEEQEEEEERKIVKVLKKRKKGKVRSKWRFQRQTSSGFQSRVRRGGARGASEEKKAVRVYSRTHPKDFSAICGKQRET